MNMTNNFLSTFPSLSLPFDQNQDFLSENILPNNISSDFQNVNNRSMMNIDYQDNQYEQFKRELLLLLTYKGRKHISENG